MTIICNVHWILKMMDGCLFNREDIPGSYFGRRMPSLCQELLSTILGKKKSDGFRVMQC